MEAALRLAGFETFTFVPEPIAAGLHFAAGLDVFGGDVIVSSRGELTLIDLNDWPSFAPCRERAAYAIADFIIKRVHAS